MREITLIVIGRPQYDDHHEIITITACYRPLSAIVHVFHSPSWEDIYLSSR